MAIPVEMPKLGNTVEECLLSRWVKHPGDTVAEGEIIAEIETDKAAFELTSPAAGTLLAVFFREGDLVPVFTNVCVVGSQGEDAEAFRPALGAPSSAAEPVSPEAPPRAPEEAAGASVAAQGAPSGISPRARRFAAAHHIVPTSPGSGPGGRVLEDDVKRLFYTGAPPAAAIPAPAAAPQRGLTVRERIARRMRESLASSAQYTLHTSADATGLVALRARFKASGRAVNINHLVVHAAVKALARMPELNAAWIDGRLALSDAIHIGFACDTPRGLLVPVVKDCGRLTLDELAARMETLAAQAASGTIGPDDLAGSTFTVSNLGSFGIEAFTPILNPPQVAILGVDAIQVRPVRVDGEIVFQDRIGLSLTCDHQAIDGAPGARFLKLLCGIIAEIETTCTT